MAPRLNTQAWRTLSCGGRRTVLTLAAGVVFGWPLLSWSQDIEIYFPSSVYGYDQQLGVTVLSRIRPGYEAPGLRAGGFIIRPVVTQSLFYNSNFNGTPGSGTWGSDTAGSVSAFSDWSRDSLGATFGFSHNQLLSLPKESYTDWNVGIAGGYTIDQNQLRVAFYHGSNHWLGTTLGAVQSTTPIPVETNTADVNYTFTFGHLDVTPDVSFGAYQYGTATVLDVAQNLAFLDRNVLAGGVTSRYSLSEEGGVLVVVRGLSSQYTNPQRGQPSNNSNSFLLLGGVDYQSKSVWRYRLLIGAEVREFQSPTYPAHTAPIAEAEVIWEPTGLTTVTGSLSRLIEDPQSAGTSGYVLTAANVSMDHELRRNVILRGNLGIQYAQFLQGNAQSNLTAGLGATWLFNRNMNLSFAYSFTRQLGTSGLSTSINPSSITTGEFSQNVVALALRLAM
jgi:hypothetical protein